MKRKKKKNKITKKGSKKELEVILKTLKDIKVSKQINQLKGIKLLSKKKINRIINKQVNLLKKLSPRNLANITSESFNTFYEDFKKQINEGDQSIHHIRFNENFDKIIFEDVIPIGERIRDMIFIKEKNIVLMVLESIPAIGVLKLKK